MALARISLSVNQPTIINTGEIIYLKRRKNKKSSLIDHYDLYEYRGGEIGGGDPTVKYLSVGPRVGDSTIATERNKGINNPHAMPVLVATGAEFHCGHGETQFISIFVYGQCHLSAEKSDLHPPEDIGVNMQMHVEYDPNICRGVVCSGPGGSPFCKAVLSVPVSHERADTTVYLTPVLLFTTPVADRDAIDGEQAPNIMDLYNTAYSEFGIEDEGRTPTMLALRKEYGANLQPLLLEASRRHYDGALDAINRSTSNRKPRKISKLLASRQEYEALVNGDPTADDYDEEIDAELQVQNSYASKTIKHFPYRSVEKGGVGRRVPRNRPGTRVRLL